MKKTQIYLISVITFGVLGFVIADGVHVPNEFTGGQPASATEVNENFHDLVDRIADIPASNVYDYSAYLSAGTITTKTYATTGLCGDIEVRTISRTTVAMGTQIDIHRLRTNMGANCQERGHQYLASATEFTLQNKFNYDGSGGSVLTSTDTFEEPIIRRNSTMNQGIAFGSSSTITNTPAGGGGSTTTGIVEVNTVLGIEDVTVPLNTYTACLKIHSLRTSSTNGAFNRISWFCPGLGEVKRTQTELNTLNYRTWELTGTS